MSKKKHKKKGGKSRSSQDIHITDVDIGYVEVHGAIHTRINGVQLSNGTELTGRDFNIAELATSKGAPVRMDSRGKWYRTDYSRDNPGCYPFNFVRCPDPPGPKAAETSGKSAAERAGSLVQLHPEMDEGRLLSDGHTGFLDVVLAVLSPTVVSHPTENDGVLSEEDQQAIKAIQNEGKNPRGKFGLTDLEKEVYQDEARWRQRIRPSAQVAPGRFVIPATSLKGMLRSVVEALTMSYVPFVSPELEGLDSNHLNHRIEGRWQDSTDKQVTGRGTCPAARASGITSGNVTQYTYDFVRQAAHIGYWMRWVPKGSTPFDKVAFLDAERHPERWTLADRLFGRVVEDTSNPNWAGRVRVETARGWETDAQGGVVPTARAADDFWLLRPLTRPTGAKAKCEAIYLVPTSAGGVEQYGNPNSRFRGRKWYWSHSLGGLGQPGAMTLKGGLACISKHGTTAESWSDPKLADAVSAFKERVHGHINAQASTKSWLKPLLPGSRFRFRIKFQNISDLELGALIKAVTLFNDDDGDLDKANYCHRLGRAKPLGFGSVILSLDGVHLLDVEKSYSSIAGHVWNDAGKTGQIRGRTAKALDDFCSDWKGDVWESLEALTRIPDELTDYDYWKNWADYQPSTSKPLPRI